MAEISWRAARASYRPWRTNSPSVEISMEKNKVLVNTTAQQRPECKKYKKEEVQLFKYLCATISKDGSCEEDVSVRIIATTAAMTKYNFGK